MDGVLAGLSMLGTSAYWFAFFAAVCMAAFAGLVPGASASLLMALAIPFIVFNIQDPVIGIVMLATITSVDTSKSVLIHNMMTSDDANTGVAFRPDQIQHRLALTNATTITATRGTAGTVTVTVPFTIMEYF